VILPSLRSSVVNFFSLAFVAKIFTRSDISIISSSSIFFITGTITSSETFTASPRLMFLFNLIFPFKKEEFERLNFLEAFAIACAAKVVIVSFRLCFSKKDLFFSGRGSGF